MERQRSLLLKVWERRPAWEFNTGTLLIIAVIVLLLTSFAMWRGPDLLTDEPKDIDEIKALDKRVAAQNAFEQTKNQVRTTLIQSIGGLLILLTVAASLGQLRTSREGQVIDRFTRAVDQLGDEQTDVRLGGIYGMKQIAEQKRQYARPIAEILAAYLKTHGVPPPEPDARDEGARSDPWFPFVRGIAGAPALERLRPDLQAVLTILIDDELWRRSMDRALDLSYVYVPYLTLPGADLSKASLIRARLSGSDLEEGDFKESDARYADFSDAWLAKSHFEEARLNGSDFRGAKLQRAQFADAALEHRARFTGARLVQAGLQRVEADEADFSGKDTALNRADFSGAHLTGASFAEADLSGANFTGATLVRADFTGANLSRAHVVDTVATNAVFDDAIIDDHTSFEHTKLDEAQKATIEALRLRTRNRPQV